jgi:hypothetical protein
MFFRDLSSLQQEFSPDETLQTALPKAVKKGFSFQSWHTKENAHNYALNHFGGHSLILKADFDLYDTPQAIVAGLLGLPVAMGLLPAVSDAAAAPAPAAAPEKAPVAPAPAAAPEKAPEPGAETYDEFMEGTDPTDPDPSADLSTSTEPLSDEEKAGLLAMLRALPPAQSKAAIVTFRKAFHISPTITRPGDAITEQRHMQFLTRLIDEAEGIPAP